MAIEEKIEQAALAQDAERNFCSEGGVGRGYARTKLGMEDVTCVRALGFDAAENFKGNFSGWTDGHRVPSEHIHRGGGKFCCARSCCSQGSRIAFASNSTRGHRPDN